MDKGGAAGNAGNGILDSDEFSISSKGVFSFKAAALSTSKEAWQKYVDVVDPGVLGFTPDATGAAYDWDGNGPLSGNQEVNGQGLKNALEDFNLNLLVTTGSSSTDKVAWFDDHGTTTTADDTLNFVRLNTPDNFWNTLHEQHLQDLALLQNNTHLQGIL